MTTPQANPNPLPDYILIGPEEMRKNREKRRGLSWEQVRAQFLAGQAQQDSAEEEKPKEHT